MKNKWGQTRCSFCDAPSYTSFDVQAGNNAEAWVTIELCEGHAAENERDETAFEKKYSERVEQMAAQPKEVLDEI